MLYFNARGVLIPLFNITRSKNIALGLAIETLSHCGTVFRSASPGFSDFVVAPAVILGIGVSVYVMHLP